MEGSVSTATGWGNSPAGGCAQHSGGTLRLGSSAGLGRRCCPPVLPGVGPYLPDGLRDAEAAAGSDEAHGRAQAHPVPHGHVQGLGAVVVAPQHLGSQKGEIRH